MYLKINILFISIFFFAIPYLSAQNVTLIPVAEQVPLSSEKPFTLSGETVVISANRWFSPQVAVFTELLGKWKNIALKNRKITSQKQTSIILLQEKQPDSAGYQIEIEKDQIIIKAGTQSGIGNALSTLLQMAVQSSKYGNGLAIPICRISDKPRFAWRGFMLDESRHFFGKTEVKKLLDQMFLFKLNRFHWHLTDEPAWRLEIKKYPLLTTIGGKGNYSDSTVPAQYYTQNDIKEIVAYAAARNILVIPEIDMPGHATAANKAYPEFTGGGSDKHPNFTFNPGKEKTYAYLTDILKETKSLFPSGIVHLGGDEVSFGNEKWNKDSDIALLRERHGLADNNAVEHYFLQRMADSARKIGLKVLGWDEMADAGLPKDSTILIWWRHDKLAQLQLAVSKGYPIILSPRIPLYFDFVQDDRDKVGRRWGKDFGSYSDLLNFPPDSLISTISEAKILGIQANLWTETVKSKSRLEYLVFPRLAAFACAAWSSKKINYENFEQGLSSYYLLWKQLDISYFDLSHPDNTPEITDKADMVKYLDNK